MKQVVIIGSGLSALSCAIALAEQGVCAKVVSPYTSERAQSVMAAGIYKNQVQQNKKNFIV